MPLHRRGDLATLDLNGQIWNNLFKIFTIGKREGLRPILGTHTGSPLTDCPLTKNVCLILVKAKFTKIFPGEKKNGKCKCHIAVLLNSIQVGHWILVTQNCLENKFLKFPKFKLNKTTKSWRKNYQWCSAKYPCCLFENEQWIVGIDELVWAKYLLQNAETWLKLQITNWRNIFQSSTKQRQQRLNLKLQIKISR